MKFVNAYFYFKDDTVVEVKSDAGIYNNRTLDMKFDGNIKALYDKSKLFAQKAEYSNSKSYLTVYDKVEIIDTKGTMVADRLFFDIKNGTLDISSMNNNLLNTQLNLK
jgi:lipopolysaccharide assembly outer membrane protein LptD (OstA)